MNKAGGGDGENTVDASGDVGELKVVGGGDVSIENNVVVVDNGADDSSHCNTAVLALDRTAALEGLGLRVKPSKRIKNTKRLSYTKLLSMDRVHGDTFPEQESRANERKKGMSSRVTLREMNIQPKEKEEFTIPGTINRIHAHVWRGLCQRVPEAAKEENNQPRRKTDCYPA